MPVKPPVEVAVIVEVPFLPALGMLIAGPDSVNPLPLALVGGGITSASINMLFVIFPVAASVPVTSTK